MRNKLFVASTIGILVSNYLTRRYVTKHKKEIINDYLDKKVVSLRVDEFMKGEGEYICLEDVIIHKSVINNSEIEVREGVAISDSVLSNNVFNQSNEQFE